MRSRSLSACAEQPPAGGREHHKHEKDCDEAPGPADRSADLVLANLLEIEDVLFARGRAADSDYARPPKEGFASVEVHEAAQPQRHVHIAAFRSDAEIKAQLGPILGTFEVGRHDAVLEYADGRADEEWQDLFASGFDAD